MNNEIERAKKARDRDSRNPMSSCFQVTNRAGQLFKHECRTD